MKKMITFLSVLMVFLPWTIFPLRTHAWALQSPTAEILIFSYVGFMIFSAVFAGLAYVKGRVRNRVMQVTLMILTLYGFAGLCLLGLAAISN